MCLTMPTSRGVSNVIRSGTEHDRRSTTRSVPGASFVFRVGTAATHARKGTTTITASPSTLSGSAPAVMARNIDDPKKDSVSYEHVRSDEKHVVWPLRDREMEVGR